MNQNTKKLPNNISETFMNIRDLDSDSLIYLSQIEFILSTYKLNELAKKLINVTISSESYRGIKNLLLCSTHETIQTLSVYDFTEGYFDINAILAINKFNSMTKIASNTNVINSTLKDNIESVLEYARTTKFPVSTKKMAYEALIKNMTQVEKNIIDIKQILETDYLKVGIDFAFDINKLPAIKSKMKD